MAPPATVTVIGGANSGKSTLVNCLLECSILPQNVTCETSVLTHVNLRSERTEPFMSVGGRVLAIGVAGVNEKIANLSEEMRERSPENQELTDVAVFCTPAEALRDIGDGTLNVLDIPGCDETDNLIVKDMLKVAASHSDVVMVNVPPETIGTESLGKLLHALEQEASHVMKPRMHKRMEVPNDVRLVFMISKCDIPVESALDDSRNNQSAEEVAAGVIAKLKAKLQAVLDRRWGQRFPHAAKAPIFAVSARNLLRNRRGTGSNAEFDWPQVEGFLRSIHAQSASLRVDRKLQQASRVINLMHEKINKCEGYPMRAQRVLGNAQWRRNVLYASGAVVGIGLCLGGGWVAVGAYQTYVAATAAAAAAQGGAATATAAAGAAWFTTTAAGFTAEAAALSAAAATSTATAASAVTASLTATAVSIGGAAVVVGSSAGAVGAKQADATIVDDPELQRIKNSEKYRDTLTSGEEVSGGNGNGEKVIYVGEFVGQKPHGAGRAFWSNGVGSESIIGEFEHGRFRRGMVLDERAAVIGIFLQDEIEGLVLDGMQPDDQTKEDPICTICCERSALWTQSRCFDKCFHGMCCEACATKVLNRSAKCPYCQQGVRKIIKFA